MDFSKLDSAFSNVPKFRLTQAKQAIFKDLIENWSEASTFPLDFREKLNQDFPLAIKHQLFPSKDGQTIKALLELTDGHRIEAVLMSHDNRHTVCVSSQVGCPLKCSFCATGQMGFTRNLTTSEIISQVILFARYLKKTQEKVTNVVFMGMGEPFLNYDNVLNAIKYLNSPETLQLGSRHFSISTSGITEGIDRLAEEPMEINLALSLHAPDDELRSQLMPIDLKYPLGAIFKSLKNYQAKTRRKIMFEYMLINNLNDTPNHAHALANLLRGYICMVNLIPYNPTGRYKAPSEASIKAFKKTLQAHHLEVAQRFSQGTDIAGACGQLANNNKTNRSQNDKL